MKVSFRTLAVGSLLLLIGLIGYLAWATNRQPELGKDPLRIYCAAGVRLPVEEVARTYEKETGVRVEFEFDGSGRLLSTIRASGQGDLYLAADESYILSAAKDDLVAEWSPIATQHPCVVMRADRRKELGIDNVDDLLDRKASLSIADPDAAAISRAARSRLLTVSTAGSENYWNRLWDSRTVTRDTVNAVANDVAGGFVDAGIIWNVTAAQYDDLEILPSPAQALQQDPNQILIAVLQSTRQPSRALHFMRFLSSADRGLPSFESRGYDVVKGDRWSRHPELTLFTGGLMSPALQQSIEEFETREGVRVLVSPDGCGVLVSKIKAGEHPDVYFACHPHFMDDVAELFSSPQDLTETDMVIAVNRSRAAELNIQGLAELGSLKDLRIGLCDPQKSALGWLSKDLLIRHGLWDSVQGKVLNWPSTAERLVESVTVDALDAAIVYRANTTLRKDDLVIVDIADRDAEAIQPIAVAHDSKYPHLSRRLIDKIRSDESRRRFESLGFRWIESSDR